MNGLKQALNSLVENRVGDSRSSARSATCVIWTGLGLDDSNNIYRVPGYNKLTRTVWVALKDRFNAFRDGSWNPSQLNREMAYLNNILYKDNKSAVDGELQERSNIDPVVSVDNINDQVGQRSIPRDKIDVPLLRELAFFRLEVQEVELAPMEGLGYDKAAPGGYVDPIFTEVIVNLNQSGNIETKNAHLSMSPRIDRSIQLRVPHGAGVAESLYRNNLFSVRVGGIRERIRRTNNSFQEMYSPTCTRSEPQIAKAGDVWFEGVRSSITNGIVEFWVDDIGMGPMQRIGRNVVIQASARYHRDTAAAEQRYATERDNPASAYLASTAITPIPTYIKDWFGDPSLYLGLMNAIIQLSAGFDSLGGNNYKEKFYDLGAFDFDKIYNKYEGQSL